MSETNESVALVGIGIELVRIRKALEALPSKRELLASMIASNLSCECLLDSLPDISVDIADRLLARLEK